MFHWNLNWVGEIEAARRFFGGWWKGQQNEHVTCRPPKDHILGLRFIPESYVCPRSCWRAQHFTDPLTLASAVPSLCTEVLMTAMVLNE